MISGRDFIVISSIEWDFLWQGHQEICSRLAQAGNRVLYIENTGVRSPGIGDMGRVAGRLASWIRTARSKGVRQVLPALWVCSPLVLPPFGSPWRRAINRRLLLPMVRRAARRLGFRNVILFSYLPTDTAVDLIQVCGTPGGLSIYYCIADFEQLTPHVQQLRKSERAMVRSCDVIFAQCQALLNHCGELNDGRTDNIDIFPFGVSLDAFPLQPAASESAPPELEDLPHPIIGYMGGLHRHVDYAMLAEAAKARPEWSWVFIGPQQADIGELAELPNVHLLGQHPHRELVRYVRRFDVCIVPYQQRPYTETVVPTKINEYLAVGKPVVSTALPEVCEFNARHQVLVTAPDSAEPFLAALEEALRMPNDAAAREKRRAVAKLSDWQARVQQMSDLIEQALQHKKP